MQFKIVNIRLKSILALIILFVMANTLYGQEFPNRPNIIYINIDDLGWKDTGFMGNTFIETPEIDKLASSGMIFKQGYAAAANCAPSRACLMTGQNTPRHGVYTVSPSARGNVKSRKLIPIENTAHIPEDFTTLADLLNQQGYQTASFGKWHIGNDPLDYGFGINYGGNHRGNPGKKGYFAPYNNLPNLLDAPVGEHLTDRLTEEALKFITRYQNGPFFAYLTYYAVHTPLMGKIELIDKYLAKKTSPDENEIYAAMVENVDTNIGRILNLLDQLELRDKTLIIFTSDNGGIRAISSQHPLRGGKGSYYEGGTRVPFIFSWSDYIDRGSQNATPIANLDIYPTIATILGVQLKSHVMDGINILPLLQGKSLEKRAMYWHFPIYLEAYNKNLDDGRDPYFRTRPGSTMVFDNWKLHHYFEDDFYELYNLDTDLGERKNLALTYPKKLNQLKVMLDDWRVSIKAPIPTVLNPEYDPDFLQK